MINNLEESNVGLEIRGSDLVPNDSLSILIGIYSPDMVAHVVEENPRIVDHWLQKLHKDFLSKKRHCEIDNDSFACFDLPAYESFERNYSGWTEGGCIKIMFDKNKPVWICKKPVRTQISSEIYSENSMTRSSYF